MIKNIFVTGMPGSGKSTLVQEVILKCADKVGLLTAEIRENGERKGFMIESSTGQKSTLAHVSFNTPFRVSRYGVDVSNLNSILPDLSNFDKEDILYLDEIGQMELFSDKFKDLVVKYMNAENIFLATLSKVYQDDFTKSLIDRDDLLIVEITKENRNAQKVFVELLLKKIVKARKYIEEPERFKIKGDFAEMRSTHAKRNLRYILGRWNCDCEFFGKYKICSHSLALQDLVSKN